MGSARSRRRAAALALLLPALMVPAPAAAAPPRAELALRIEGLRNARGMVMLCLTRRTGDDFLKCKDDPARRTRLVPATEAAAVSLSGLEPGEYSLLLIHDENRNGKLDKAMGVPREGFGFSHNPKIRMGPPRYQDVHFTLPAGRSEQVVKVRYLL